MTNQSNVSLQTSIRERRIIANVRNIGLYLIETLQLQKKGVTVGITFSIKSLLMVSSGAWNSVNWKTICWTIGFLSSSKQCGCHASVKKMQTLWRKRGRVMIDPQKSASLRWAWFCFFPPGGGCCWCSFQSGLYLLFNLFFHLMVKCSFCLIAIL